jgi:hypothetical protein
MVDQSISPADVHGRSRVDDLAPTDPFRALAIARSIEHPWYRCQSLASVAQHLDRQKALEVIEEAFASAQLQADINRIVSVSAWPLSTLAKIDADRAVDHIQTLIHQAEREPHTLRRADALYCLAWAVSGDTTILARVVSPLKDALLHGVGWRIDRLICRTVHLIKNSMPDVARVLVEHHRDGLKKHQMLEQIGKGIA